jgi:tyrosine decarboxylase/aspartate 1-decarboxylase
MCKEQYPSVTLMERDAINWLASLFNNKNYSSVKDPLGYISSGGTVANIVAFWAARNKERLRGGKRFKIIVPESAHYSKVKIEDLLGLKCVSIPVDEETQIVNVEDVEKAIDDETLGIYATAGTSRFGLIDPIKEFSDLAIKHNLHLHVDAAFGGYILPFMKMLDNEVPDWDFSLPGVSSITVDPHKMGLCPLGAGAIIFRDESFIKAYRYKADFPKITNNSLEGSKCGGAVAATWAMQQYWGIEGYKNNVKNILSIIDYIKNSILSLEGVSLVLNPIPTNILGFDFGSNENNRIILEKLKQLGFQISGLRNNSGVRIIIHSHVKLEHARRIINCITELHNIIVKNKEELSFSSFDSVLNELKVIQGAEPLVFEEEE